jgi:FkbM family methyltransferase
MRYKIIRNGLRKLGIDLSSYPNGNLLRKLELLNLNKINLIFDVGASDGGFAKQMRSIGYRERIVSFEPISVSFKKLAKNAQSDKYWTAVNLALGSSDEEIEIHVAGNFDSSSILMMNDFHLIANPDSEYKTKELIHVKRLDSISANYIDEKSNVLLKLDVQGYEKQVLEGAIQSLKSFKGVQLEMSFEELYQGSTTFVEMKKWIESEGFTLCLLESGNRDRTTGKLLQADGTFYRI